MIQKTGGGTTKVIQKYKASPLVLGGGLVLGSVAIVGLSMLAAAAFNAAVTVVFYGIVAVMLVAFWVLFPAIVRSLRIAKRAIDKKVTQANPILALEDQLIQLRKEIEERKGAVQAAGGALEMLKRTFSTNSSRMTPDKKQQWLDTIAKREASMEIARKNIRTMEDSYDDFKLIIDDARAEMSMAEADESMAAALGKTGQTVEFSTNTQDALEAIARRVGAAKEAMDMSMDALNRDMSTKVGA